MPFVSFEEATQQFNKQSQPKNQVGFFGLKDGEEAIVRFMYAAREDFSDSIIKSHEIPVNGNTRRIFCTKKHAFDTTCPICNSSLTFQDRWGNDKKVNQLSTKVYLKIVQYETENMTIVPKAKIWERNTSILTDLGDFMDNFGPLEDMIYKIKRTGSGKETKYTILPVINNTYTNNPDYAKNKSLFENYSVLGTIVLNKTPEEFAIYEQTGEFPKAQKNNEVTPEASDVPEIPSFNQNSGFMETPPAPEKMPWETVAPQQPQQNMFNNTQPMQPAWNTNQAPWDTNTQQVEKPTRFF